MHLNNSLQLFAGVPTWQEYLTDHLPSPNSRIGINPTLIAFNDSKSLSSDKKPQTLVPISSNLVDLVWASDRPNRSKNTVFPLEEKYSGESVASKLARLASSVSTNSPKPRALILTALDDIAWLFNLRGSDIAYNPVFFSYAVVHFGEKHPTAVLFLQHDSVEPGADLQTALGSQVEIRSYEDVWAYLKDLGSQLHSESSGGEPEKLVLIPDKASLAIAQAVGEEISTIIPSPVTVLKAIKNPVELEGSRQLHTRDGIALARYFAWLEERLQNDQPDLTEWEGAEQLEQFRRYVTSSRLKFSYLIHRCRELPLFKGLSFDTISSTGPNGGAVSSLCFLFFTA